MKPSTRNAIVLGLLGVGTIGLAIGLLAPLWGFTSSPAGDPSYRHSALFSVGPPGAYFQSYAIGVGSPPPPQATLDLDIAVWVDLAFGAVAGVVAILRGVVGLRRDSTPPLTHGAGGTALGLGLIASLLAFVEGPTAYAPATGCPTCTAYSGSSGTIVWSWSPEVGALAVLVAVGAFVAALLLASRGIPEPGRWSARFGAGGIAAGIALFSFVIGSNWQAWYPTGTPYLLLWVAIVALPVVSTVVAVWGIRRRRRATAQRPRTGSIEDSTA